MPFRRRRARQTASSPALGHRTANAFVACGRERGRRCHDRALYSRLLTAGPPCAPVVISGIFRVLRILREDILQAAGRGHTDYLFLVSPRLPNAIAQRKSCPCRTGFTIDVEAAAISGKSWRMAWLRMQNTKRVALRWTQGTGCPCTLTRFSAP